MYINEAQKWHPERFFFNRRLTYRLYKLSANEAYFCAK